MATFATLEIVHEKAVVSLLRGEDGFYLKSWRPTLAQYKGGGTWQSSPLADGRRIVHRQWDNALESLEIVASGWDEDEVILSLQKLYRVLESSVAYWAAEWTGSPGYIVAQASCETNPRYAIVKSWSSPDIDNPFAQPFKNNAKSAMDGILLNIERGHWQDAIPGETNCIQIQAKESYARETLGAYDSYTPAALGDLIMAQWEHVDEIVIGGVANVLTMGYDHPDHWNNVIRFPSVVIPQNATILDAFVRFTAKANDATTIKVRLYGHDVGDSTQFTTAQQVEDAFSDEVTEAFVYWDDATAWVAASTYDSPNIRDIVKEIVARSDWASGQAMSIMIDEYIFSGNRNYGGFGNNPPELHILLGAERGRDATCLEEVFVQNAHTRGQLTHIFVYDNNLASFSTNLYDSSDFKLFPFLPPIIPNSGDIIYFGQRSSLSDQGPFASLVFDINNPNAFDATSAWEYWNGAWVALNTSDTTQLNPGASQYALANQGVGAVFFERPSDWATTAINGVTAWWVRCRLTGAAAATSYQVNREVYNITWPFVEIPAASVGGDIPALLQVNTRVLSSRCNQVYAGNPQLYAHKLFAGLRSVNRGIDFTSHLNIADEQNDTRLTVSVSNDTTFANASNAPTGRRAVYNPAGVAAMATQVTIDFASDLVWQYYGTYRLFLRGRQSGGSADELYVRIQQVINTVTGDIVLNTSETKQFPGTSAFQLIDFGRFDFPGFSSLDGVNELIGSPQIIIQAESTSGTPGDLHFIDLILLPVDEWAIEAIDGEPSGYLTYLGGEDVAEPFYRYLSIDSAGYPKRNMRALVKVTDLEVRGGWRYQANGPVFAQSESRQRLWFLFGRNDDTGSLAESEFYYSPEIGGSVAVRGVERYLSMRGAD